MATQEDFLEHRELLFSVVYNMLGSVSDTEDVLQETWLAWAPREGVENPRAYLVRVAVNAALARQAAIRRRRETYLGPWLPEPLVTEEPDHVESVSMAMMVVLETLTPLERAVFVLHEVFAYTHVEIATILDRTPAAVRQVAHRARGHVQARRPRSRTTSEAGRRVTERFLQAAVGGDLDELMQLLAPDVTMWIDGGGTSKVSVMNPVHGRDKVARLITGISSRRPANLDVRARVVNGDPSAVLFGDHGPFAVMVVDLTPDGKQVAGVYTVTNPDKLSHIGRP
ncbi:RNA polymerase sigma factor SigJ [Nonomuraea sp. NPDC050556]|uniref:RNA polymerase sigma factor SigJ n=1 Tax=Nonomuraea sp. NPDC050556 TaxID=3364369 RepID=UPI0037A183DE